MNLNIRRFWRIILTVAVLMLGIGIVTDPSDLKHYTHQMNKLMAEGRYQEALEVGNESDKTNTELLQLRIEALAHEHQLGERLFHYPVIGKSGNMAKRGGDEELCAYLIDKQLDRFVAALPQYYSSLDNLPRYYREALVLYNHLRSHPTIIYHDAVLDTDYRDMQQLERKYKDKAARHVAVFQQYEFTYWYYYGYLNQTPKALLMLP